MNARSMVVFLVGLAMSDSAGQEPPAGTASSQWKEIMEMNEAAKKSLIKGDSKGAAQKARECLDLLEQHSVYLSDGQFAGIIGSGGSILHSAGHHGEALLLARRGHELSVKRFGERSAHAASALRNVGVSLEAIEPKRPDLEKLYKEVLERHTTLLPAGHAELVRSQTQLGLYYRKNNPRQAVELLEAAYQVAVKELPSSAREFMRITSGLADAYFELGRLTDSAAILEQTIKTMNGNETIPKTVRVATLIQNANILSHMGHEEAALAEFLKADKMAAELWQNDPSSQNKFGRMKVRRGLSAVYDKLGRKQECLAILLPLSAEYKEGEEPLELADVYAYLSRIAMEKKDYTAGINHYERVLAIRRRLLGDNDDRTIATQRSLREVKQMLGRN